MKQTIEVDLKWYETRQNNSGGRFIVDDAVAHFVLVQATSAQEAQRKLEELTEPSSDDWCECCGERWYISVAEGDGTDKPTLYDKPLEEYDAWFRDEARLHYYNGVIETVKLQRKK